ncbi:uncharacterized protein LOC134747152 [Cydia strobilella]|uniref:uncharacterized protein LOC134747152 n=1 Tax=Cydia strobilella TaxID=1100964 RepID=UPI003003BBF4
MEPCCHRRSQIGRCRSRASFKNQQNLQRAMDVARKLVMRSPIPEGSRGASSISMPATPGHTLLELIKDISEEVGPTPEGGSTPLTKSPWKSPSSTRTNNGGDTEHAAEVSHAISEAPLAPQIPRADGQVPFAP